MTRSGEGEREGHSDGNGAPLAFPHPIILSSPHPLSALTLPALLAAVLLASWVPLLLDRAFDPDELEHLHAGYCVWRGMVPYRDFFEHHGPATYYLMQPLFALLGPTTDVLFAARALMAVLSLGTLALTYRVGTLLYGRAAGIAAVAFVLLVPFFHQKAMELRPDVPATLLTVAAVWVVVRRIEKPPRLFSLPPCRGGPGWGGREGGEKPGCQKPGFRTAALAGLLVSLATLFTQKAVVPGIGLAIGLTVVCGAARPGGALLDKPAVPLRRARRALGRALVTVVVFAIAAGVPWLIALALFATAGAAADMLHGTIVQMLVWPMRLSPWGFLVLTVGSGITFWGFAAWQGVLEAWRAVRGGWWAHGRLVIVVVVAVSAASLLWVKAAYPQYYLPWLPMVAVLAGRRLVVIAAWAAGWPPHPNPPPQGGRGNAAAYRPPTPALPHKGGGGRRALVAGLLIAVLGYELVLLVALMNRHAAVWELPFAATIVLAFAGLWALWAARRVRSDALQRVEQLDGEDPPKAVATNHARRLGGTAGLSSSAAGHIAAWCLALVGMVYSLKLLADAFERPNAPQLAAIRYVNELVPPDGAVLDGFSGYGALRPHACYYWWINEYSLALMSPEERSEGMIDCLETARPVVVILDHELRRLPAEVIEAIHRNYVPSEMRPIYVRRR